MPQRAAVDSTKRAAFESPDCGANTHVLCSTHCQTLEAAKLTADHTAERQAHPAALWPAQLPAQWCADHAAF